MRCFQVFANCGSICVPLSSASTGISWELEEGSYEEVEGGSYEEVEGGSYEDIKTGLCDNMEDRSYENIEKDLYCNVEDRPDGAPEVYLSLNLELGMVDDARFLISFRIKDQLFQLTRLKINAHV